MHTGSLVSREQCTVYGALRYHGSVWSSRKKYGHRLWGSLRWNSPLDVHQDRSQNRSQLTADPGDQLLGPLSAHFNHDQPHKLVHRKQRIKMPPHLVKIKLDGDLRIMEIPTPPSFDGLVKAVAEAYAVPAGNEKRFAFTYRDADGDEVRVGRHRDMLVCPKV